MNRDPDRLYALLPEIYRVRDAERGGPLRALLRVIAEQVEVVEGEIDQIYANWFIETCERWVIPYLGDLVGYELPATLEPGTDPERAALRGRMLAPRRAVANAIRLRRRKGTPGLLESLAADLAGWPAYAVEFVPFLAVGQPVTFIQGGRGRTVDLRRGDALELIGTPFDVATHTVDVRRPDSTRTPGTYNIPNVGVFLWRLGVYRVMETPAYNAEDAGPHCFTFSALGNDTALFTVAEAGDDPALTPTPLNVPAPIGRRALERHTGFYYGPRRSLMIWAGQDRRPVPADQIVAADLSRWRYRPAADTVAVDPVLGRIAFPPRSAPRTGVWVSYAYGFSAEIGGGEYERTLLQPSEHTLALTPIRPDDLIDPAALAAELGLGATGNGAGPADGETRPTDGEATDEVGEAGGPVDVGRPEEAGGPAEEGERADTDEDELRRAVVAHLNGLLRDEELGLREPFDGRSLPRTDLLRQWEEATPRGWEVWRFNRLLLEARFPGLIRPLFAVYRVGRGERQTRIGEALARWAEERPRHAVIEIVESDIYTEQFALEIPAGESLQLRAASGARPVIRLLDYEASRSDALRISGAGGGCVTLDGLLIAHRGVQIEGDLAEVVIRHCTLVPGWALRSDCEPQRPAEPSIVLLNYTGRLTIDHSIVGTIQSYQDEVLADPAPIALADSVLDATAPKREALHSPGRAAAHALLTVQRSTIVGRVEVHAVALAEDCIFEGILRVARRGLGCLRFCSYVPDDPRYGEDASRTPRRYACQPDRAEAARAAELDETLDEATRAAILQAERERVRPRFHSLRYGTPTYARLADDCPAEISAGAEDGSEMGVFHDLYQPQRLAALRAGVAESIPAGMAAGIFPIS